MLLDAFVSTKHSGEIGGTLPGAGNATCLRDANLALLLRQGCVTGVC